MERCPSDSQASRLVANFARRGSAARALAWQGKLFQIPGSKLCAAPRRYAHGSSTTTVREGCPVAFSNRLHQHARQSTEPSGTDHSQSASAAAGAATHRQSSSSCTRSARRRPQASSNALSGEASSRSAAAAPTRASRARSRPGGTARPARTRSTGRRRFEPRTVPSFL